ncbi:hypothetical protein HOV93_17490 [Planctomycetes bacterium FF15]|uniref:Uncharacterized protein n=1 Tax=Bremerella alba TaxID=980252 RepID=A0A7V8V459_9BACT|nr:hypothetical protein [Bremerella alba]
MLLLGICIGCSRPRQAPPKPEPDAIKSKSIDPQRVLKSADSDPQPLPPTVYQDSDGSVDLSPLTAKLIGEGIDLNEWDQIVGFKNRDQRVLWQIHISTPGTYQIEVDAICTSPTQEARMRVYIGDTRFLEDLIQLSDNDQTLTTTRLGEITLDAPKEYRIEIEMVGLPLIGKFSISEVRLVPLEENPSSLPKFQTEDGFNEGN